MARPLVTLILEARRALDINQVELATLVSSGLRTVQRWEKATSKPAPVHLQKLANALETRNPALAAELDAWAPRPQPAAPPAAPRFLAHLLVDSVVCAGAEAISLPPQALRPALRAALLRAREAGLTLDELIHVLAGAPSSTG